MPSQYMSQLRKETIKRLADHGLELLIEYDETSGKDGAYPALYCKQTSNECVWVGIDNEDKPFNDPTKTIDELLADYCKETLSCTVNDIIWCLAQKYEDNGTRYKVIDSDGCWGSESYMLMYMLKAGVIKSHKVESISYCFEKDLRQMMKEHAIEYSSWVNNEILKLTVVPKQKIVNTPLDNQSAIEHGVIPIRDEVDYHTDRVLDEVIGCINSYDKSGISLSLLVDRDMPSYINKPLYFIRTMEHVFGFTPVLGWCNFSVVDGLFNIELSLDSLPPFSVLKANTIKKLQGERFDLVNSLQSNIGWLIDNNKFELMNLWDSLDAALRGSPYSEWPPVLINALMMTLCQPIRTMRLEASGIFESEGRLGAVNKLIINYRD